MLFEEKKIKLIDGRSGILRPARVEDAAECLKLFKRVVRETNFLATSSEDKEPTVDSEKEFIQKYLDGDRKFLIFAEVCGEIVGNCALHPMGSVKRHQHTGEFGISILKQYWGLGIGTELIEYTIALAKQSKFEYINLRVASKNVRAIGLYENCGFFMYGKLPNALKYKNGTYDHELIMSKTL